MFIFYCRACNFKYITVEWNRPSSYGRAQLICYKLYINGKVEAILSAEQNTFTMSKGEPCREYKFQIQVRARFEIIMTMIYFSLILKYIYLYFFKIKSN
jgi:hypothetical protein